jgi:cytoskeleton protein RodZ
VKTKGRTGVQTATNFDKPVPDSAGTVGHILRTKRVELGFELADAARETRIPLRHLDAIESDSYDKQPLYPYAVGFVRNYAKFLGLDADPVVRQFKSETTSQDPSVTATAPEPLDESRLPTRGLVIGSVLAGAAVLGLIGYFALRPTDQPAEPEAPLAQSADPATPAPEPVLSETVAPPVGTPAVPPPAPLPPATDTPAVSPATTGVPAAGGTLAALPAAAPVAVPPPASGAISPVGVVIRANEDSWIKISDGGPRSLKVGILKAGETYSVPGTPGIRLLTGNAGGLDIFVNGRAMPALGAKGATAKNVSLSADALQARSVPAVAPQR